MLGVKGLSILHIEMTEEERDAILSIFDECEHDLNASEMSNLQYKFPILKQYIKALFSRAHTK